MMKRIIMHWTAGTHAATDYARGHYHGLVEGDGTVVLGKYGPEANESTRDGHYVAHTRALNTGSIGLSVCAMGNAVERPFNAGKWPITEVQVDAFVRMVADYAETYDIPITRRTVLTHAEVQPTLGVKQRGKWDIVWLPGMAGPGDPIEVGDVLRAKVRAVMDGDDAKPQDDTANLFKTIEDALAELKERM